ncbi:MAG: imelysin family protein [Sneathiella sp.]
MIITFPVNADGEDFSDVINRFSRDFAIPAYTQFYEASEKAMESIDLLCHLPSKEAKAATQSAFSDLVASWSIVEAIRFGPIRDDNRFEKIFFWPDPRSRGLRQVQRKLAKMEEGTAPVQLKFAGMSVAVQGLPALEFLLYGMGNEVLTSGSRGGARCGFAAAISRNIYQISRDVLATWTVKGGYADYLIRVSEANSDFQNNSEVMQSILKSGSELLLLAANSKLGSSVQNSVEKAKPKRAPFWRSNLTILNLRGNVRSVVRMHEKMQLETLVPAEDRSVADQLIFEASLVQKTLEKLESEAPPWVEKLKTSDTHQLLQYVQIPMNSIEQALSVSYPEFLGLKLGFNSLDGD